MTVAMMMSALEQYYGEKYTGLFRSVVSEYLAGYEEWELEQLTQATMRSFSRRWGKAPDVEVFESAWKDAHKTYCDPIQPWLPSETAVTDEELAETARLVEESKKTTLGQWLFGKIFQGEKP